MQTIRWGILGCGKIARKFASDLTHVEGSQLIACGSRDNHNSGVFALEFSIPHIHGSYEALASDPEVDVIYIASPHGLHHEHALLCLQHRKAVLCEKAFAINGKQVAEMVNEAKKQGVFLMEALWSKFTPQYLIAVQMVRDGLIGKLRSMLVDFGFTPEAPVASRLFEPALGGGSLLDIGVYNVFYILSFMGRPDDILAKMTPASTGVDEQCAATFYYKDGRLAQLFCTFSSNLPTEAQINGSNGRIKLGPRFYNPTTCKIDYYPQRIDSRQEIPFPSEPGFGYQFQARHVCDCLRKGLTESPVMSHADSLLLIETLDRIRVSAGIKYAVD